MNSGQLKHTNNNYTQQEIFDFNHNNDLNWNSFIASDENAVALSYLTAWPNWSKNVLIICGESGTGKTHLANLWKQTANAIEISQESFYLSPRSMFDDNKCNNFILENFDRIIGVENYDWLFHFLNILSEKNRYLLILSRQHVSSMRICLKDLQSRLASYAFVEIERAGDDLLLQIARKISRDLGIYISDKSLMLILQIINRDVASLSDALKKLNKLSLQQKKNINPSFVRKYLF